MWFSASLGTLILLKNLSLLPVCSYQGCHSYSGKTRAHQTKAKNSWHRSVSSTRWYLHSAEGWNTRTVICLLDSSQSVLEAIHVGACREALLPQPGLGTCAKGQDSTSGTMWGRTNSPSRIRRGWKGHHSHGKKKYGYFSGRQDRRAGTSPAQLAASLCFTQ